MRSDRLRRVASRKAIEDRTRRVLVCLANDVLAGRIRSALHGHADLLPVASFADLSAFFDDNGGAVDSIVVTPYDRTGTHAGPTIENVVKRYPHTAVVAYCSVGADHSASLRTMVVAGAHEFMFDGVDDRDRASTRALLDSAHRALAAETAARSVASHVPPSLHPIVSTSARNPTLRLPSEVGQALGVSARALCLWCTESNFMSPGALISWCRLVVAALRLDQRSTTVESVALELGFSSGTGLQNLYARRLGCSAGTAQVRGGGSYVVGGFIDQLNAHAGPTSPRAVAPGP